MQPSQTKPTISINKLIIGKIANIPQCNVQEFDVGSRVTNFFSIDEGCYSAQSLIEDLNSKLHHMQFIPEPNIDEHHLWYRPEFMDISNSAQVNIITSTSLLMALGLIGYGKAVASDINLTYHFMKEMPGLSLIHI